MNSNTEMALERLVSLLDEQGIDGIATWRKERREAREQAAARLRAANTYYVGLVGIVSVRDMLSGSVREVEYVTDVYPVAYEELPDFSAKHGLNTDELIDVLELRRKEVKARGKVWRAGKGTYIDRSTLEADRRALEAEDEAMRAKVEAIRAAASVPTTVPMYPQQKNWRMN